MNTSENVKICDYTRLYVWSMTALGKELYFCYVTCNHLNKKYNINNNNKLVSRLVFPPVALYSGAHFLSQLPPSSPELPLQQDKQQRHPRGRGYCSSLEQATGDVAGSEPAAQTGREPAPLSCCMLETSKWPQPKFSKIAFSVQNIKPMRKNEPSDPLSALSMHGKQQENEKGEEKRHLD